MSKERRPASSFGGAAESPAGEPGDSEAPDPPATAGSVVVGPPVAVVVTRAKPRRGAKRALLALARRIFPAPGDLELRASARAGQAGAPAPTAGSPTPEPAPETPSGPAEDPGPPAED